MQLVLDSSEEAFGRLGGRIIIQSRGIQICDFLIKSAFRQPDFPDFLQLFLEVIFGQNGASVFQAFFIHDPALDRIILYNAIGPFAELNCPFIFNLKTNCNNCL